LSRHIWVALPAYTGTVHLATMRSIISDIMAFADRGDRVTIFDEAGNAMIGDCRGLIVSKFLESDGTDLIFVDWDVSWQAGAMLRLVDHPVDFVAGLYPQRRDPLNYCCQWDQSKPEIELSEHGLIEVLGVPAGFMRLTRAMLEKMVDGFPDTQFYCAEAPNETVHDLFGAYRVGKIKFGEDYSFCRRWRDLGGKIWVDPEITMGHCGFKTFIGNVGEWLKAGGADGAGVAG
jgi:hypothetical protein